VRAFEQLVKLKEPPAGQGVLCEITKKIPIGAGLGGGSSNCAVALIALNSLLDIDLDIKKLSAIGSELGSDVPFFFTGGTSFVYGRGEKIEMLPEISRCGFIIAVPPLKVDTKTAYDYLDKNREITGSMSSESPIPHETRQFWSDAILNNNFAPYMCNDFEETIIKNYPEIEKAKKRLENLSGTVLMSGSGSAVFAYFQDYDDAWKALENYEPLTGEFLFIASPVKEGYIING
jgi:4-diphosphocytidyl-2-C-methyl-D-erythritol kinase